MIVTSFKLKNEQKASGIDMEMSDAETAIEGLTEKKMQLNEWIEMAHRGRGIENIKTKRMWRKDIMKRSIRSDTLFARKK